MPRGTVARSSFEFTFGRTFTLLILLVVLPSAGLSGFGVLAILNERAAVEKRLEVVWAGKLETLARDLLEALGSTPWVLGEHPQLLSSAGEAEPLSDAGFVFRDGQLAADSPALQAALTPLAHALVSLTEEPVFFSFESPEGPQLIAARRVGGVVEGARIPLAALNRFLQSLPGAKSSPSQGVRFEVRAVRREARDGLVGKLVSGVVAARKALTGPSPLAERSLPPPASELSLAVVPVGIDPVARTSTRNRIIYGVLLLLFYGTLAVGVVYTGRVLYREARLSRMKTDFVSLLGHELRTPLTSIRMFIETLSMGRVRDPGESQEVLELLARETGRLSEMIERVLDWGRIESGRKQYHAIPTSVALLVEDALAAFKVQRLATGFQAPPQLDCDVKADLPMVQVDREAMAGALLNLLQNAAKYGGTPNRIVVRAWAEGKGVAVEIEDNGAGIAQRDRKRIFERFYRVDDLLTRKTEGSGLGLAIAKRIVESHGGRITLKSELGRGSCFTVHLRAAKPKHEKKATL